jgi:peptidoglycan/xylan/chitin deacetylase (PgdA/CDA1 family)
VRAVLTFHSVDDSGSVLSIAPQELRALVAEIQASGHAIVPLRELLADADDRPDRVALTFDDGYRSVWEHAGPVLDAAGAPATLFVTTGYLGRDSRWPTLPEAAPVFPLMDWEQVRDLHARGWAIEAHTETHPDLRALPDAEIEREFRASNDAIERELGVRPRVLAYPYGHFDARVERIAREHYELAVTVQMARVERRPDSHRVPRLETFYFRGGCPWGGFGSRGFSAYLALRALIRALPKP